MTTDQKASSPAPGLPGPGSDRINPPIRPDPPNAGAAPDAASLLRSLRRRWARASTLGMAVALVTGLATWTLMPSPKFVARATLQASSAPPSLLPGASGDRTDFGTYVRTQIALLKSRLVIDALLARPGVAGLAPLRSTVDPLEWLEKEIAVDPPSGTELLKVSIKGDEPGDLVRLLDELIEVYMVASRDREARERSERLRKLTESYDRYLADRSGRRGALQAFSEKVGSNDRRTLTVKQELDLERQEVARRELLYLQSDLRKARVELGVVEAQGRLDPDQSATAQALAEQVSSDPVVGSHVTRIAELEDRLASARRTARGDDDPSIRRVQQQLDSARRAISDRSDEVVKSAGRRAGAAGARELAVRIASGRERVAILEEHERLLRNEVDRLAEETRDRNRESIGLEDSRADFDQADAMVRKIAAEIETQRVELVAPSRIKLLEKAGVLARRDTRPRIKATATASGGAFVLLVLVVLWREAQAGRVESTQDVKRQLGLKMLGVLPRLSDRHRRWVRRPDSDHSPHRASLYFESIDATRAVLLRNLGEARSAVVLVSSAVRAEGKTSLSCHLAASLARSGRSTLLVDGDLRIPTAHGLLGLDQGLGLSEVLRGEALAPDLIRPTGLDHLAFLGAGECDSAALDALGRGGFAAIIAALRVRYDIVIVDSSPILPVADPIHFGRHCDAVVLSILEGVSTVPGIRDALDRLGSLDVPTLGAVVAGSPMMHYKYQFYRKSPRQARSSQSLRSMHSPSTARPNIPKSPKTAS